MNRSQLVTVPPVWIFLQGLTFHMTAGEVIGTIYSPYNHFHRHTTHLICSLHLSCLAHNFNRSI